MDVALINSAIAVLMTQHEAHSDALIACAKRGISTFFIK